MARRAPAPFLTTGQEEKDVDETGGKELTHLAEKQSWFLTVSIDS